MQYLPLSKTEQNKLTELVVLYKKQPGNKALRLLVHEKTQQLLYELPSFLNILEEEDCCEFFLYCYDTIDHFITRFQTGKLSYYAYIVEVVRRRCRFFVYQRSKEQFREQVILEHDYEYQDDTEEVAETCSYTVLN
ncbi:MAG: hypothetical protein EOM15_11395, partial [Spirochaetia bacterium]|nr:hypothetical protein [Spirochaetia bacterium]